MIIPVIPAPPAGYPSHHPLSNGTRPFRALPAGIVKLHCGTSDCLHRDSTEQSPSPDRAAFPKAAPRPTPRVDVQPHATCRGQEQGFHPDGSSPQEDRY